MAIILRKNWTTQSISEEFLGAKIKCIEDYAQPTIRTNPEHIVIHVGTNNLLSKKESAEISRDMVKLVLKLISDTFQVSVPNLTAGNDQYRKKALEISIYSKSAFESCVSGEKHQHY